MKFIHFGDHMIDVAATRPTQSEPLGTNRDFQLTLSTSAAEAIWELWTSPETWSQWDRGLRDASLKGPMRLGSVGEIIPLAGRPARFEVTEFEPKRSYAFTTNLPLGSKLTVRRSFSESHRAFTHHVTFKGPISALFALAFGPGFQRALPPTMQALKQLAERS